MWNFIKGLFKTKKPLASFFLALWKGGLLLMAASLLYSMGVWGFIVFLFISPKLLKKLQAEAKRLKEIDTVPYWGNIFGLEQTIRLLDDDSIKPYVLKDGTVCKDVCISESGRWLYVQGRYYPIHLICDFNKTTNVLTMINNVKVKGQYWLSSDEAVKALDEILYSNKRALYNDYNRIVGEDRKRAFEKAWPGSLKDLGKADWNDIRYDWEVNLANIETAKMERSSYNKHMEGLKTTKLAKREMYERVLTGREINSIANAIRSGKIENTDGWFDISLFKNDMCVGNGVTLADNLRYPLNRNATEFLFDCIKDIRKPYFNLAIFTLSQFPRDELIALIEKYVEKAKADGDVLFGAGLLSLSHRIGYEISLKKFSREKETLEGEDADNEFEKMVLSQGRM